MSPAEAQLSEGRDRGWQPGAEVTRQTGNEVPSPCGRFSDPPPTALCFTSHFYFPRCPGGGSIFGVGLTPRSGCRWLLAGLPPSLLLCPSG